MKCLGVGDIFCLNIILSGERLNNLCLVKKKCIQYSYGENKVGWFSYTNDYHQQSLKSDGWINGSLNIHVNICQFKS